MFAFYSPKKIVILGWRVVKRQKGRSRNFLQAIERLELPSPAFIPENVVKSSFPAAAGPSELCYNQLLP
jgi:hypothetical protein